MVHALAAATVALLTSAASQFAPTLVEHPIACSETIYLDGSDWIASNDNAIHRSLPATVPGDIITDLQRAGRVKDPYWNVTWRDPHFVEQWNNGTYTFTKQFPSPTSASAARCRAWLFCVPWPLHLPCGETLPCSGVHVVTACSLLLTPTYLPPTPPPPISLYIRSCIFFNAFPYFSQNKKSGETMLVFDGIRMGATIALNGKFLGNISDQFLRYRYPVHDVLLAAGNDNVLEVTFHKSIATGGRYTYR